MTTLNTENADHLIYKHPSMDIAILGGIRLEGLDRMRTTLKIQVDHLNLRHNLDLYNDTQVEKLIRKVAEKLEIGTSVIAAALMELTDLLEAYRLQELEQQNKAEDKRKMLSPEEIKQAKQYLSAPNLMERTKEDIGRAGVIGETDNRLLMYLIFTSRKRANPLHVISLGSSGIGKTHLQEKVAALIPEEDKLEITTLSSNAFYYFGQQELRNKLILIEDLDGAEDVLYPLRELQSKNKINKTVVIKNKKGDTRTITLKVEGPVSVAGCTTRESLYEDNANRSFMLYIDESKEQDQRIMEYQRKLSAGKIDLTQQQELVEQFQHMQRVLLPVAVRNPYAEKLVIPEEVFKPRRTNAHYLAFIEAVTFYHQYQREKQYDKETGEEYIETTLEDIQEANQLMKEVLLRKSDQLNGATRNYFEVLKAHLIKACPEGNEGTKTTFSNREIRQQLRIKGTTLRRYHNQLLDTGLIRIKEGKKATGYQYEIVSPDEYEALKNKVDHVLGEFFLTCSSVVNQGSPNPDGRRRANTPSVSHKQNGSVKNKKSS